MAYVLLQVDAWGDRERTQRLLLWFAHPCRPGEAASARDFFAQEWVLASEGIDRDEPVTVVHTADTLAELDAWYQEQINPPAYFAPTPPQQRQRDVQ